MTCTVFYENGASPVYVGTLAITGWQLLYFKIKSNDYLSEEINNPY
ncbi:MAG: hypothetical protein AAGJ18_07715 [Bacteroidota bacterium]